ncbi:MAG: hypothetical protein KAS23_03760 [Anaerohalosphaera sp.]|nr:hypothetical protein [Anaerohalosphaera sp.]
MEELFVRIGEAFEGSYVTGLGAAFVWGVLSVLLSPCHLASIPLIVGYVGQREVGGKWRSYVLSCIFSLGILVSIIVIGGITAAMGGLVGDIGGIGNYIVAIIFFVFGLVLLDVISLPWSGPGQVGYKKGGGIGAFVLGLIFGVAVGPCTFAYMAPMLAVVFKCAGSEWVYAAGMLMLYGLGHCGVIALAGGSGELVGRYLGWNERSKASVILRKTFGAGMILCGLYLLYVAR